MDSDSTIGERLRFGEFELTPAARSLWRNGEQIKLGSRALDILIALASRPGQILSKDELTKLVWRGALVDETALRVAISAVRKALRPDGDSYISTVPGRGYSFILDVTTTPSKSPKEPSHLDHLTPQRLPARIARVVGRDEVVAALAIKVIQLRLVSLVGPGGIGKTTVAVAVGNMLRAEFDMIAFMDLTSIENGTQISEAAAAALGLNMRRQEDPIGEIAVAIGGRRVLIVADNCEHLVDSAASFIEGLLGSAPGVTVLATSRERLRADGEWVHFLSPLDTPPVSPTLTAEAARSYSAIELFEERAAFALGGYQVSDADAPYVAEICRRLDGIALAIELAAGRIAGLGVEGLANSLEDCFSVLTHGRRTALPRHQTLRATLDWSFRLLSREDQGALRNLSVFSGTFTLEDAAYVMSPSVRLGEANDCLSRLLDKSLIAARREERTLRYSLLETTRTYGQNKLKQAGETDILRRRHAQRFLEVCRNSASRGGSDPLVGHATADIRAALEWSLVRGENLDLGFKLASAATPVCLRLSLLREHRKYLDLALNYISASANSASNNKVVLRSEMSLRTAVALADYYTEGQALTAEKQLQSAREIARRIGDTSHELKVLWMLFGMASNVGNYRRAFEYAQSYVTASQRSEDPAVEFHCNRILARVHSDLGQHSRALDYVRQAFQRNPTPIPRIPVHAYEIDHWIAASATFARILWLRGYPDLAKSEAERCIADALHVGHEQSTCWAIAFNLCPVAIWRGDFNLAASLVNLLLERSERVFEHYHEWGLLYRQFLDGTISASEPDQTRVPSHSNAKAKIPSQSDLFVTFDAGRVEPDILERALADEDIWCAPEVLRAWANHLTSKGSKTANVEAELMLLRSLKLAQRQDAKAWELRTATTLASLYLQSGRTGEARAILEPTLIQFEQGQDTKDFQAAASVLTALSG